MGKGKVATTKRDWLWGSSDPDKQPPGEYDDLWLDGHPDDLPQWKQAGLMAGAPPRPGRGYGTYSLAWLSRVRSHVHSTDQLIVLLLIYRRCVVSRSRTISLPNGELAAFGISRQTKYRLLSWLQRAGIAAVQNQNGQASQVTLHWFP
jgi:hypothetical protein